MILPLIISVYFSFYVYFLVFQVTNEWEIITYNHCRCHRLLLLAPFLVPSLTGLTDPLVEAGVIARQVPGEEEGVKLGAHTALQLGREGWRWRQ